MEASQETTNIDEISICLYDSLLPGLNEQIPEEKGTLGDQVFAICVRTIIVIMQVLFLVQFGFDSIQNKVLLGLIILAYLCCVGACFLKKGKWYKCLMGSDFLIQGFCIFYTISYSLWPDQAIWNGILGAVFVMLPLIHLATRKKFRDQIDLD